MKKSIHPVIWFTTLFALLSFSFVKAETKAETKKDEDSLPNQPWCTEDDKNAEDSECILELESFPGWEPYVDRDGDTVVFSDRWIRKNGSEYLLIGRWKYLPAKVSYYIVEDGIRLKGTVRFMHTMQKIKKGQALKDFPIQEYQYYDR